MRQQPVRNGISSFSADPARQHGHPSAAAAASQTADLLAWFRAGHSLTQDDARALFGCTRLAARVWDLRAAGYAVRKRMVRNQDGRLVAEYALVEPPGS